MKTWKETNAGSILETHKKMQPVIETKLYSIGQSFLLQVAYNSRMQFKSKPFHLRLSAVTVHYCRMISAAAKLHILYASVQIKPISSKESKYKSRK